eukprot:scpid80436/ scgid23975/ 
MLHSVKTVSVVLPGVVGALHADMLLAVGIPAQQWCEVRTEHFLFLPPRPPSSMVIAVQFSPSSASLLNWSQWSVQWCEDVCATTFEFEQTATAWTSRVLQPYLQRDGNVGSRLQFVFQAVL